MNIIFLLSIQSEKQKQIDSRRSRKAKSHHRRLSHHTYKSNNVKQNQEFPSQLSNHNHLFDDRDNINSSIENKHDVQISTIDLIDSEIIMTEVNPVVNKIDESFANNFFQHLIIGIAGKLPLDISM